MARSCCLPAQPVPAKVFAATGTSETILVFRMQSACSLLNRSHFLRSFCIPQTLSRKKNISFFGPRLALAVRAGTFEAAAEVASEVAGDLSGAPATRLSVAERRRQRRVHLEADSESPDSQPGFRAAARERANISPSEPSGADGWESRVRNRSRAPREGQSQSRSLESERRRPRASVIVESGDAIARPSQRNFTVGEARARQFNDAVRFLNKDTGRPLPPRKPLVQPEVISRGKVPEVWEGSQGSVILVDKPLQWTSNQACKRLKFELKLKKIGHAGTLDPMATGLLILVAGPATKLMEVYQAQTKRYSGTIRIGETTPSLDTETEVDERFPWEHVTDDDIAAAPEGFFGEIMQVPPIYSALQVGGERLYKKARRGETMEIAARPVTIERLRLWRDTEEAQHVHFEVVCSKGTYVRSLARDIGVAMNTGAHLVALRREAIGDFDVKDAWAIEDLLKHWKAHKAAEKESRIFRSPALTAAQEPPTLTL